MRPSRSSLLPFFMLHEVHAATTLSQTVRPPRERGTMWSKVRFSAGDFSPQYWQVKPSRRKTLKRVNAGRLVARTYRLSEMTLGSRISTEGECTRRSYSEMMLTRSRNTALTDSRHDQSDSGK